MENKLKEMYREIPAPELKAEIFAQIHGKKLPKPHRRLKTTAILAAAAILLTVTAGAAVVGSVKLLPGVTVLFRDDAGNLVRPEGYHLEQGADAPLSEKALANIAPYICHPADNLFYETTTRAEMEEFLDRKLHIPTAAEELEGTGLKYVLRAFGADGEAETISVSLYGDSVECSFGVNLKTNPYSLITGSRAELREYALPDGTPVTIAVFRA
ncbi:MAG: hypothetical protein IJF67_10205, partial [Clostridia bacterium]|nr:hypothetical protein [Clostridia bacterium]